MFTDPVNVPRPVSKLRSLSLSPAVYLDSFDPVSDG